MCAQICVLAYMPHVCVYVFRSIFDVASFGILNPSTIRLLDFWPVVKVKSLVVQREKSCILTSLKGAFWPQYFSLKNSVHGDDGYRGATAASHVVLERKKKLNNLNSVTAVTSTVIEVTTVNLSYRSHDSQCWVTMPQSDSITQIEDLNYSYRESVLIAANPSPLNQT